MSHMQLQCKLARNYTMEGVEKALAYLLVKTVPDASADFGKLPLNLVLVLDISGSMYGEKLERAKEAACLLVEGLSKNDFLSLVVFNDSAKVIISRKKVEDKSAFFSRIKGINADDGTRMDTGMGAGLKEMREASTSSVNRMLLFTDGQTDGEDECLRIARQVAQGKLAVSTFGIGDDYNEELLQEISRITLGGAYPLQHPEQIKELFINELKSATSIGFTAASLTLQLAKGVALEEVHRIVPNIAKIDLPATDDRTYLADIGSLDKTDTTCFGIKLTLPARSAGQVRIAQVTSKYDVPSVGISQATEKCDVIVEYTKDRDLCGRIDKEVIGYFDQLSAQQLVEQAAKAAQAGNVAAATQKLTQARALTQRIGNVAMTQFLQQSIDELEKKGTISAGTQKTIRLGSTHTVRIQEPT